MKENNSLMRFIIAQEEFYHQALEEIKRGYKETHWMWFIFPQISGLGISDKAQYYELKDIDEVKAYLENAFLKDHLLEISTALLEIDKDDALEVLGYPDNLKLKSSMTLFNYFEPNTVFQAVLDKYYDGALDEKTIDILHSMSHTYKK